MIVTCEHCGFKNEVLFTTKKVDKKLKVEEIKNVVCEYFKRDFSELVTANKKRRIAYERQVLMYFLANENILTLKKIGEMFNRDHTTVMHAKQTVKNYLDVEETVIEDIETIRNMLHLSIRGLRLADNVPSEDNIPPENLKGCNELI